MNDVDRIAGFLTAYFYDDPYKDAILAIQHQITRYPQTRETWDLLTEIIRGRQLLPGQALTLVNHKANQVLDENSDEEAYVWLDKMIRNVERDDGIIEEYGSSDHV